MPASPEDPGHLPGSGPPTPEHATRSDPEAVLAQALRAMAGGGKPGRTGEQAAPALLPRTRLSVLQIVLIATILGLLIGITGGLITLLV
jgi:hypothetical protein